MQHEGSYFSVVFSLATHTRTFNTWYVKRENVLKPEVTIITQKRALKGVPIHICVQGEKSHRLSEWLSCSSLNPILIFYCFIADESRFPSKKLANPSSHFTPWGPSQKQSDEKIVTVTYLIYIYSGYIWSDL